MSSSEVFENMIPIKNALRKGLRRCGYQVTRLRPANRFQAMEETLILLRRRGYSPKIVIDAGANRGTWTSMARSVFPSASFHMIEPQPVCTRALRELAESSARLHVYPVAITAPGVSEVRMVGGGVNGGGTGAWVAEHEEKGLDGVNCPATTLDHLFAGKIPRDARCLCKLDLERHELTALKGAARILRSVEIVLTEVHFFDVNGAGRPIFAHMVSFLQTQGFELYDFASLGARPRDMRLQIGDVVFVRNDSPLLTDNSWQ